MTPRHGPAKSLAFLCACLLFAPADDAVAAQRRSRSGPSPEQIAKMKEEMGYRQREMARVQQEVAAKERELYLSFDENGNGKLEGAEKAKYEKQLQAIRSGKAANPFASIVPAGQGPRETDAKAPAAAAKKK